MLLKCSLSLCVFVAFSCALKLPDYITQCKDDDHLNECALASAKAGIGKILEGDSKYGVPKMNPLTLPLVDLAPGNGLKLHLENVVVNGLETINIEDIKIDTKNNHWTVKANFDFLRLNCKYEIDGKILILPITGKGNGEVEFVKPEYTFEFDSVSVERKGETYITVVNPQLHFPVFQTKYSFENLFNGDKRLGDEMNKFLNENWEEVNKDLGPAFGDAISSIISGIVTNIALKVPLNEIFG